MKQGHGSAYAFVAIGITEMRHQRNFIDLGQRIQARPSGSESLRGKTQAVHARVHFEKDPMWLMGFMHCQHVNLRF